MEKPSRFPSLCLPPPSAAKRALASNGTRRSALPPRPPELSERGSRFPAGKSKKQSLPISVGTRRPETAASSHAGRFAFRRFRFRARRQKRWRRRQLPRSEEARRRSSGLLTQLPFDCRRGNFPVARGPLVVPGRSQVSLRHHQRLAGAQDGAAHVHGLALPHGEGVPLPQSRPSLTRRCSSVRFGLIGCVWAEPLGRRGEPGGYPVRGEPERTASHHRDEEARRPPDRVSGASRALGSDDSVRDSLFVPFDFSGSTT